MQCPNCHGEGSRIIEILLGYVSREMAMDAGEMDMQGQPVYGDELQYCERCSGTGELNMHRIVEDDNGELWVIPVDKTEEWWDWHDGIFSTEGWDEKYPEYATFVVDLFGLFFNDFTVANWAVESEEDLE